MHAHFDILCFVLYFRLFWRTVEPCVFYAYGVLLYAFFIMEVIMALLKCPECGKENVSDTAVSCPDCGFSIQDYVKAKQDEEYIKQEKERLQTELAKKLSEIDLLQKPQKPTISKTIMSDNRFIFVIFAIVSAIGLIVTIYTLVAFGKPDGFSLIATLFCSVIALIGVSDIKKGYNEKLSEYEDFEGYKQKKKQRIQDNYDYKIKHIKSKQETTPPAIINTGLICPVCGSRSVKRISTTSRVTSVALVGLASSKIGKQYECKNCNHKW